VSTHIQQRAQPPRPVWRAPGSPRASVDLADEIALVAQSARGLLLSVHRHLLGFEDLEDCYSQATVELLAQARAGRLRCANRVHLRNTLRLRFASRIADRRRAIRGRSPSQAVLASSLSLGPGGERAVEIADPRADVERGALLRAQLRSIERAAQALSPDQRLVLACQVGLQMSAGEFCRRFGWTHEKHRKVAQRARSRLRRLLQEPAAGGAGPSRPGVPLRGTGREGKQGPAYEPLFPHT
jgi:DNA-directed RNA polymerase specialized sigma24 family protein